MARRPKATYEPQAEVQDLVAITAALAHHLPPAAEPTAAPASPLPERISLARGAARCEDEEDVLDPDDALPLPAGWTRWNPDRDRARGAIIIG